MSKQDDFKMQHVDIKCPVCGESKYMRFMQGKNVGELDMVCINCGRYFMSKNFPQIGQQAEDVPVTNVGDTIYRQDAIAEIDRWVQAFKETRHMQSASDAPFIKCGIAELPPAQSQRIPGKWEEKNVCDDKNIIEQWQSARCSACGKYHTTPYMYYFSNYNFCPHCGADMRERRIKMCDEELDWMQRQWNLEAEELNGEEENNEGLRE